MSIRDGEGDLRLEFYRDGRLHILYEPWQVGSYEDDNDTRCVMGSRRSYVACIVIRLSSLLSYVIWHSPLSHVVGKDMPQSSLMLTHSQDRPFRTLLFLSPRAERKCSAMMRISRRREGDANVTRTGHSMHILVSSDGTLL